MTEVDLYAVEARKHGMSYGEYERAIGHGWLPKPKMPKAKAAAAPKRKTIETCRGCGNLFEVYYTKSGRAKNGVYCTECLKTRWKRNDAEKLQQKTAVCAICKTEFVYFRTQNGYFSVRKLCDDCRKKHSHLTGEQRKAFAQGEQSLERLEEFLHGRTPYVR